MGGGLALPVLTTLFGLLAALAAPAAIADDATTLPCVASGASATGPDAAGTCWIDWTGLDFNDAGYYSMSGKRITVSMPGGRATAMLRITGDDASWRAVGYQPGAVKDIHPEWTSLWRGYALPDSITFPAFQPPKPGVLSVELSGMKVTPTGAASNLDDWGMTFADGEIAGNEEGITVESDGTITDLGLAQGDGHSTTGNTFDGTDGTVTMRGTTDSGTRYSASVMAASSPTRIKASMTDGPGRGSVAFGFRLPYLALVSVDYDANGGTGSMEGRRHAMGETVTVADSGFAYAGHVFTGWNTKADGSGVAYKPGDRLVVAEDTTLYAQ